MQTDPSLTFTAIEAKGWFSVSASILAGLLTSEPCWSKLKTRLGAIKAGRRDVPDEALAHVINTATASDTKNDSLIAVMAFTHLLTALNSVKWLKEMLV